MPGQFRQKAILTFLAICLALAYIVGQESPAWSKSTKSGHGVSSRQEIYLKAMSAYKAGKLGESAAFLEAIVGQADAEAELAPKSEADLLAKSYNLLGKIYQKKGQLPLAIKQFKQALCVDSQSADAKYNLAVAYLQLGNHKEATEYFLEAVKESDNKVLKVECLLALSGIKEDTKEKPAAIEFAKTAIEVDPNSSKAHYSLGRLYQVDGQSEQAEGEYSNAIKLDPKYKEAYNNLGVVYAQMGKSKEAVEQYQKALKIDPQYLEAQRNLGYAEAHTSLGITYYQRGEYKKAFDEYKKALQIDSGYASAHYNLALLYEAKNQFAKAADHYNAAIKLYPRNAISATSLSKAYNNLGNVYVRLNKLDLAELQYRQALKLNPQLKEAKRNLDMLLKRMGRPLS